MLEVREELRWVLRAGAYIGSTTNHPTGATCTHLESRMCAPLMPPQWPLLKILFFSFFPSSPPAWNVWIFLSKDNWVLLAPLACIGFINVLEKGMLSCSELVIVSSARSSLCYTALLHRHPLFVFFGATNKNNSIQQILHALTSQDALVALLGQVNTTGNNVMPKIAVAEAFLSPVNMFLSTCMHLWHILYHCKQWYSKKKQKSPRT